MLTFPASQQLAGDCPTTPAEWRALAAEIRRYLCVRLVGQGPLCAEGSGPLVSVKVERPQRSEDVRPWRTRGPVQARYGPVGGGVGAPSVT
jgi:hypothetical protein